MNQGAHMLSLIITGLGGLLVAFVGIVLVIAIVLFIMRQAGAPPVLYTILYVFIAVVALLFVIDYFFGASGGTVIVR